MNYKFLVYKWTNLVNGRVYVGSDTRGGRRKAQHLFCIKKGCINCGNLFHRAVRKYGIENFRYEVLQQGFVDSKELLDAEDGFIETENSLAPNGYNIMLNRYWGAGDPRHREEKDMPEWAKNDEDVRKILLRSFPKLKTDPKQRTAAGRWARIIYLYFKLGYTNTQTAHEIGINPGNIHTTIAGIRRVAEGRRYDGRGMLGVRPRGRPRKVMP